MEMKKHYQLGINYWMYNWAEHTVCIWIYELMYFYVGSNKLATLNMTQPFSAVFSEKQNSILILMQFPSLVKTLNKKAEKNKKNTAKIPNSTSEGEGHYKSIKEGEQKNDDTLACYGKFTIS